MKPDSITRICLWSGPRNISTALMYSFAQRADTVVFDEPLYGYYLSHSKAKAYHPGASEVIDVMENDGIKVVQMMLGPHSKPVVFFKHMTHHLLDLDRSFMKNVYNVILTRDPEDMLPSYAKEIAHPTMRDVGYQDHIELLDDLISRGIPPIVIDSKQLLMNPPNILHQLCHLLGIPMDQAMLSWKASPRPEDGVWAKYWYDRVHQSTGFGPDQPRNGLFPDALIPLLEACTPYYKRLKALSLTVAN